MARQTGSTALLPLLAFVASCGSTTSLDRDLELAKSEAPAAPSRPVPFVDVDGSALGDCRRQLGELLRIHDRGDVPDPDELPFAVVIGPDVGRLRYAPPSIPVVNDVPIPINAAGSAGASCLIRIARPEVLDADWQVLGQEAVASEYQSGTRRDENPAYEVLKIRAREAERARDDAGLSIWQGGADPLAELVGVLVGGIASGFGEASSERELNEVRMELAKTPSKINTPVYQTYHFERRVIDAVKRAEVWVELVDRRHPAASVGTTLRTTERRQFHVPIGLHARDRHYLQHRGRSITRDGLVAWTRSSPTLQMSEIVATLVTAREGGPTTRDPTRRAAAPSAPDRSDDAASWFRDDPALDAAFRGTKDPGPALDWTDAPDPPTARERAGRSWRMD